MTDALFLVESAVSLDDEGPIGRWRGWQNNFTNEFQVKTSTDLIVIYLYAKLKEIHMLCIDIFTTIKPA